MRERVASELERKDAVLTFVAGPFLSAVDIFIRLQ